MTRIALLNQTHPQKYWSSACVRIQKNEQIIYFITRQSTEKESQMFLLLCFGKVMSLLLKQLGAPSGAGCSWPEKEMKEAKKIFGSIPSRNKTKKKEPKKCETNVGKSEPRKRRKHFRSSLRLSPPWCSLFYVLVSSFIFRFLCVFASQQW